MPGTTGTRYVSSLPPVASPRKTERTASSMTSLRFRSPRVRTGNGGLGSAELHELLLQDEWILLAVGLEGSGEKADLVVDLLRVDRRHRPERLRVRRRADSGSPPEDEQVREGVAAEPVCSVQAGGDLARGKQPGHR